MKIIKAYPVTAPTLHQSLTEAGWLDSIKQRVVGTHKQAPNDAPASTPDIARPSAKTEADDPLTHVVTSILSPVSHGQVRVVAYMNIADLKALYLKDDDSSHAKLAAALLPKAEAPKPAAKAASTGPQPSDNDVRSTQQAEQFTFLKAVINEDPITPKPKVSPKSKIVALKPGYKFSDIIKGAGGSQVSVLLDIPDQLYDEYNKAQPADKVKLLTQMLNHKYYAMSISNSAAAKIAPAVDKVSGDLDAEKAAINPSIIVNHPGAQTIKQAKLEWNQKYAEEHAKLTGENPVQPAKIVKKQTKPAQPTEPAPSTDQPATPNHPHSVDANVTTPQTTVKATHDSLMSIARQFKKDDPYRKVLDKAIEVLGLIHKAPSIK